MEEEEEEDEVGLARPIAMLRSLGCACEPETSEKREKLALLLPPLTTGVAA